MAKGGKLAREAAELCAPAVEALGLALVDVDFLKEGKNQVLRLYIDKRGGVSLDDCAAVTRAVNPILDEGFSWNAPYLMEVSSPGLDRPLKTDADLLRHQGDELLLRFYKAQEGLKEMNGILLDLDEDCLRLRRCDAQGAPGEQICALPRSNIALIRRAIRF